MFSSASIIQQAAWYLPGVLHWSIERSKNFIAASLALLIAYRARRKQREEKKERVFILWSAINHADRAGLSTLGLEKVPYRFVTVFSILSSFRLASNEIIWNRRIPLDSFGTDFPREESRQSL